MRTVYLDGQFVPESEAKLSIYDLSVMQACAAFEMTRSFGGVPFKLREHLARLRRSCDLVSIPWPHGNLPWPMQDEDPLETLCEAVAARNDHGVGEEHRLLLVVSPGCAPMYKDLEGTIDHPFLYIADFPLRYTVAGFGRYFTEGVHCVTSKVQQVPDACVPSQAKHRSRLHFHLAQQQAPPGTWPLLQRKGTPLVPSALAYCEAPGANLVYVDLGGGVRTIEASALPGISMQTVKDLTHATPGSLAGNSIYQVRELWLTGTPFCMLPVVSLDGKPIGDGKIGPVYLETLYKWNHLVGLDIREQIERWDLPSKALWTPDVERARATQH